MKIAYISSSAYSDADLSFVSEAQKQQVDITYFVLVHPRNLRSCAFDFRKDKLNEGVNEGYRIVGLAKYCDLIDIDKSFVLYSEAKHSYSLKSLSFWYKIYCFLKKEKFDIIHYTTAPCFANPFAYLMRKKVVLTVHDPMPHSSTTRRSTELQRKLAFKWIKHIILLNKSQKEEFKQHYGISRATIYDSALSSYTYLKRYDYIDSPINKEYILFVGNINSYKGLDILFPAMEKVHEKCVDLNLVVAGGGKYYFDIEKYRNLPYFDIRNYFIPDNELAAFIKGAKFVVVPYIDATQSGVVMSAYAYYKPCVATNVGGLPEMVVDGQYGLICQASDIDSLADSIVRLYSYPTLVTEFRENIRRDYKDGIKSWSAIVCSMKTIYLNIVS